MPLTFEWDDKKARSNARKHSISFGEASTVFADLLSLSIPDLPQSHAEDRYVTIGSTHRGKMLVVDHTQRGDNIRIISARPASRPEQRTDEERQ